MNKLVKIDFNNNTSSCNHNNHDSFIKAIEINFIRPFLINKIQEILQSKATLRSEISEELNLLQKFKPSDQAFLQQVILIQKKCSTATDKQGGKIGVQADILLDILVQFAHILSFSEYLHVSSCFELLEAIEIFSAGDPDGQTRDSSLDAEALQFFKTLRAEDKEKSASTGSIYKSLPENWGSTKNDPDHFYKDLQENFQRIKTDIINQYANKPTVYFKELVENLENEFFHPNSPATPNGGKNRNFDKSSKCLVMTQRVLAVTVLEKYFKKTLGYNTVKITGRSSMADTTTKKAIQQLKENKAQVIFATNTVKEGFDMPACKLTVRYGIIENAIDKQQAAGRTRAESGKTIYIGPGSSFRNFSNDLKLELMEDCFKSLQKQSVERNNDFRELMKLLQKESIVEKIIEQRNIEIDKSRYRTPKTLKLSMTSVLCKRCRSRVCGMGDLRKYGSHFLINLDHLDMNKFCYIKKPSTVKKQWKGENDFSELEQQEYKVICNMTDSTDGTTCRDNDFGRLCKIAGREYITLKCQSVVFKMENLVEFRQHKKWKDVEMVEMIEELKERIILPEI